MIFLSEIHMKSIAKIHKLWPFLLLLIFLVWDHLEDHNQEFFRAYYVRQALKDQILTFNELLEKQARLMQPESVDSPSNSWYVTSSMLCRISFDCKASKT